MTPEQLKELLALSDDVLERFDGDALSGNPTVVGHRLVRAAVLLAADNGKRLERMEARLAQVVDFASARRTMAMAFRDDPGPGGIRDTYVANVAMLLHDRWDITDRDDRTRAANEILDLIFES